MNKIGRESQHKAGGGGNAILAGGTDAGKIDRACGHGKGGTRRTAKADQQGANVRTCKSSVQVDGDSFRAALLKTRHQLHDAQSGVKMDVERRVTNHSVLRVAQFGTQRGIQCLAVGQLPRERLDCRRFEINRCRRGQAMNEILGPSEIAAGLDVQRRPLFYRLMRDCSNRAFGLDCTQSAKRHARGAGRREGNTIGVDRPRAGAAAKPGRGTGRGFQQVAPALRRRRPQSECLARRMRVTCGRRHKGCRRRRRTQSHAPHSTANRKL